MGGGGGGLESMVLKYLCVWGVLESMVLKYLGGGGGVGEHGTEIFVKL